VLAGARLSPSLAPFLVRGLERRAGPCLRRFAAWTLGWMRSAAAPAAPALTAALADPDLLARIAAVEALGRLGPAASAALGRLEELAAGGEDLLSRHAALARERILGR
jgi:HEAT repeat protein